MPQVHAAAVYARISLDQDGAALGVKRELLDCQRLADALGWVVAEEYVDNEKFQIRKWNLEDPNSLRDVVAHVNKIRRQNTALQQTTDIRFHGTDSDALMAFSKRGHDGNVVLVVATVTARLAPPVNGSKDAVCRNITSPCGISGLCVYITGAPSSRDPDDHVRTVPLSASWPVMMAMSRKFKSATHSPGSLIVSAACP